MIKSLVFSGLKQDANMHGENYSTTETFGRVILAKMSRQVANYQGAVANFKERMFKMELTLAGFNPEKVKVTYEAPTIGDRKAEAETETIEIDNARALYNDGLIGQQKRAEMLSNITGEESPDQEEPRVTEKTEGSDPKGDDTKSETDTKTSASSTMEYQKLLVKNGASSQQYDYSMPEECGSLSMAESSDFKDSKMTAFASKYVREVNVIFNSAIDTSISSMIASVEKVVKYEEKPAVKVLEAAIMVPLLNQWSSNFTTPIREVVDNNVGTMYNHYRKDEKPFRDAEGFSKQGKEKTSFFDIPEAVFTLLDARAIEYLSSLDHVWLGKFITDPDTIGRITRFIEEEVITNNLTLGANGEAVSSFVERFADQVKLENWKMRRIVETTANKVRNTANVMYIDQAGVKKYEVVEVLDQKTCGWCRHMHGKQFSVNTTVNKLDKAASTPFNDISSVTPFATTVDLNQFTQLSAIELQSMGFDVPSFHCHCRGRITGVI